jgi:tRNA pseudouridine38-40 synthase
LARYRLALEYAGTRYRGWQVQRNARSVQEELQRAIAEVTGQTRFELYGSGRTDAGVHALLQMAHLDVAAELPPERLRLGINDLLPPDIHVLSVERVSHRFHARHGAVGRSYLYQIARRRTAFAKPFVWWIKDPLDVEAMRKAASLFVGMHDFRSFSDADPEAGSTRVLVEAVEVGEEGDLVLIRVRGSHFLWKMVRRIVGVVAEIGRGGLALADVARFLEEGSEVPAQLTAPPSGLFLEQVLYEGEAFDRPLRSAVGVTTWVPRRVAGAAEPASASREPARPDAGRARRAGPLRGRERGAGAWRKPDGPRGFGAGERPGRRPPRRGPR